MANGKTLDLIALSRSLRWRDQPDRETRERDRSLAGKKRIRARRAAK